MRVRVRKARIRFDVAGLSAEATSRAEKALAETALTAVAIAKSVHAGGGAGGPPSLPGNPPRVQSGFLLSNIDIDRKSGLLYYLGFRRAAFYGAIHEQGGTFGARKKRAYTIRFPRRPILEPTRQRLMPHLRRIFAKHGLPLRSI
jgi:hypothetical protein